MSVLRDSNTLEAAERSLGSSVTETRDVPALRENAGDLAPLLGVVLPTTTKWLIGLTRGQPTDCVMPCFQHAYDGNGA